MWEPVNIASVNQALSRIEACLRKRANFVLAAAYMHALFAKLRRSSCVSGGTSTAGPRGRGTAGPCFPGTPPACLHRAAESLS